MNRIEKIKVFVGDKTWKLFWVATTVGFLWFLVEASFVFVLQGFLKSIGLLSAAQVFLPEWFPTSFKASVVILVLFGVFRALVFMFKNYFATGAQISFTCYQRSRLLAYGIREAGEISPKEMITVFSELVTQSGIVIFFISMLINTFVTSILFFFMGLRLAAYEMLIGVTLLSLIIYPLRFLNKRITYLGKKIVEEWEKLNESLLRGLKNSFLLRIYNQFESEIEKGDQSLRNHEKHYMSYSLIVGIIGSFPLLVGVIILSFIAYLSVHFFHTQPMKLVSFFYIFIRLAQTASEGNTVLASVRLNWPGFKILYDWSILAQDKIDSKIFKNAKKLEAKSISIKLENVSFGYKKDKLLLKNMNIEISTGDILVIKGESGVGKSTLLSLILGVNPPISGKVLINSIDTSLASLDLHKFLAYVGPEPYLIEGSIRDNLRYGLDANILVSDDEMYDVLSKLELREIVWNLPRKLDEFIFEIPQLSTGQKQRLSFARALIRKPILLVLDEATANLDNETEFKILYNLTNYFKSCTTVIVTHKNSFDQIATHQVKLEK